LTLGERGENSAKRKKEKPPERLLKNEGKSHVLQREITEECEGVPVEGEAARSESLLVIQKKRELGKPLKKKERLQNRAGEKGSRAVRGIKGSRKAFSYGEIWGKEPARMVGSLLEIGATCAQTGN